MGAQGSAHGLGMMARVYRNTVDPLERIKKNAMSRWGEDSLSALPDKNAGQLPFT